MFLVNKLKQASTWLDKHPGVILLIIIIVAAIAVFCILS